MTLCAKSLHFQERAWQCLAGILREGNSSKNLNKVMLISQQSTAKGKESLIWSSVITLFQQFWPTKRCPGLGNLCQLFRTKYHQTLIQGSEYGVIS